MIDYKEYTKMRDIAQKRIKRGQAAGYPLHVHVPTVKELRAGTAENAEKSFYALESFLQVGFSLARRREAARPKLSEAEKRARKNQQNRDYRRRKVAKEYERAEHPKTYQGYLKGLKRLGMDVPPSKLPSFFAYMDFRYAQGKSSEKKYMFDQFVDDFLKMLEKGYNPDQIVSDYQKFLADQAILDDKADGMTGMNYDRASETWDRFMEAKGIDIDDMDDEDY